MHAQSGGPAVVFRASKRLPPDAAICGTALSAGTKSDTLEVVTGVRPPHALVDGVHAVNVAPSYRAQPPAFAAYKTPFSPSMESARAVPLALRSWAGKTSLPPVLKGDGMERMPGTPDPPPSTSPTYTVVPIDAADDTPRVPSPLGPRYTRPAYANTYEKPVPSAKGSCATGAASETWAVAARATETGPPELVPVALTSSCSDPGPPVVYVQVKVTV